MNILLAAAPRKAFTLFGVQTSLPHPCPRERGDVVEGRGRYCYSIRPARQMVSGRKDLEHSSLRIAHALGSLCLAGFADPSLPKTALHKSQWEQKHVTPNYLSYFFCESLIVCLPHIQQTAMEDPASYDQFFCGGPTSCWSLKMLCPALRVGWPRRTAQGEGCWEPWGATTHCLQSPHLTAPSKHSLRSGEPEGPSQTKKCHCICSITVLVLLTIKTRL